MFCRVTLQHTSLALTPVLCVNGFIVDRSLSCRHVPGGTVNSLLKRFGQLEERVMKQYAVQCVLALKHLHSNKLAHTELHLDNLMVAPDGTMKLAAAASGLETVCPKFGCVAH